MSDILCTLLALWSIVGAISVVAMLFDGTMPQGNWKQRCFGYLVLGPVVWFGALLAVILYYVISGLVSLYDLIWEALGDK